MPSKNAVYLLMKILNEKTTNISKCFYAVAASYSYQHALYSYSYVCIYPHSMYVGIQSKHTQIIVNINRFNKFHLPVICICTLNVHFIIFFHYFLCILLFILILVMLFLRDVCISPSTLSIF